MNKFTIWYYDTSNKAGFADVYVHDTVKGVAYMFEARNSNYVYNTAKIKSCIDFISKEFDLLDVCDSYGELKERFPRYWTGVEKTKSKKP